MIYCKEVKGHKLGDTTVSEEVATMFGFDIKYNDDDVEKAWDGTLWERGFAPEKPAPTREEISSLREQAYIKEVDVLHARKRRKTSLGTWTEEDEANYIAEVKRRSEDIANRYPYQNVE